MATDYLLTEDSFKIILEDGAGDLILESSTVAGGFAGLSLLPFGAG